MIEINEKTKMKYCIMYASIQSDYRPKKAIELLKNQTIDEYYESIPQDVIFKNQNFITINDSNYPIRIKNLESPPLCFFYKGKIDLLDRATIGIIGSRENDEYGKIVVRELVKKLPKDQVVVSGLAKGIDGLAHYYALEFGIPTIGIIGSGFSYVYPKCNEVLYENIQKNGLLLSEYAFDEKIRKEHFIARNRLIAAISDILVVIESTLHSGTLITVNEMLALGKEVYVVPHPLFSKLGEGNLKLLYEGANVLYSIDEFVKCIKRV